MLFRSFPLTEVSARLGYLPMTDEAWFTTPNPYWHFLTDQPKFPPLMSQPQGHLFEQPLCEKSLSALEEIFLEPVITQRKILLEKPIEMAIMGNLFKVKLLQFSVPSIALTLNICSSLGLLGVLKHTVNLFSEIIQVKRELKQTWKLREMSEDPSPTYFDARSNPNPIMNILIWNCRGAMKPNFKTAFDLIEWH